MQHLLSIEQLNFKQIQLLINRANAFKQGERPLFSKENTVANLFYEDSTRTRISFEMAAQKLGLSIINLPLTSSSESKGESISDTILNLEAMGINLFVFRHQDCHLIAALAERVKNKTHFINAGSGTNHHPSQALLDLMTIQTHKPNLSDLKIAIVGNIKHSRVASSLQHILCKSGIQQLFLVAPQKWLPTDPYFGEMTESLAVGLKDADVIICLRVQKERLLEDDLLDLEWYRANYSLTSSSFAPAKKNALVMHPGPVNWGVEIDTSFANCAQSVILEQVNNGVFMRMAIIEALLNKTLK